MSTRSIDKGKRAERAVVNWLRANGFLHAERRISGMDNDTGDITGIPGVVIDVKDRVQAKPTTWIDQFIDELDNTPGDPVGFVAWKRAGTTDVGQWHAMLPVHLIARLLREAGYGAPPGHGTSLKGGRCTECGLYSDELFDGVCLDCEGAMTSEAVKS